MRYQIGQVVPFVAYNNISNGNKSLAIRFNHTPADHHSVCVSMMTCVAHQKKSSGVDGKSQVDVFTFKDKQGRHWETHYSPSDSNSLKMFDKDLVQLQLGEEMLEAAISDGVRAFQQRDALARLDLYLSYTVTCGGSWEKHSRTHSLYAELCNEIEKVSGRLISIEQAKNPLDGGGSGALRRHVLK